jgi:2-dehydro-3-deoxyphosphooctonate aldolase (KDO 8-P synthase)
MTVVRIADDVFAGEGQPLLVLAGPCVVEEREFMLRTADMIKAICDKHRTGLVFKSSFDKANRSSGGSARGPGMEEGLAILAAVKEKVGVPVVTDVHESWQAAPAAEVADVLQIPAFLCRQTDVLVAAAKTGRVVNIKKGQFLAPDDVKHAVAKVRDAGNSRVLITERGTSFGYHNLVVDMRAFPMIREQGVPVIFDVTHSLQLPGGGDGVTAGLAEYIEPLAAAGVAAGVDGVFLEVHDDPARAKSDAQNALRLDRVEPLLRHLMAIDRLAKAYETERPAKAAAHKTLET